jgi:hypothetical protein
MYLHAIQRSIFNHTRPKNSLGYGMYGRLKEQVIFFSAEIQLFRNFPTHKNLLPVKNDNRN